MSSLDGAPVRLVPFQPSQQGGVSLRAPVIELLDQVGRSGQPRHHRHTRVTSGPPGFGVPFGGMNDVGTGSPDRSEDREPVADDLSARRGDPAVTDALDDDSTLLLRRRTLTARDDVHVVASAGQSTPEGGRVSTDPSKRRRGRVFGG